ncbi:putative RecB family nuclease [Thermotoga sp. Mc24]|uniref:TM0106 family RecB-like putative nuclease n=1 Tax=Thermotoga sp. Mc24 TaxID=1231241 RepID=UPI000543BB7D|nr:TM0106 family RecB-like putative nuclease [Thermotoga sp. Mc24]KHC93422.1 putative RecB family nuclease [Thermotoga sp. Mc24]
MTISYEDMENFLVCPRRYYLSKKISKEVSPNFSEELMEAGFPLENPVIVCEFEGHGLVSNPDLVVKERDGWRIILRKNAKRFKDKYILESAYHALVFSKAGLKVSGVEIVSDSFSRKMENWKNLIPIVEDVLREMLTLDDDPHPRVGKHCRYCDFLEDCEGKLLEEKSLLLVNGIGEETYRVLYGMGIETLEDLAGADQRILEKVFGKEKGKRFIMAARAFLENRVIMITPPEDLPEGTIVDIEYHPAEESDFLYGFLIGDEYRYFLEEDQGDLIAFLNSLDDESVFYHYHGPEKRKLISLIGRNKRMNFLDVFSILRNHFVFPVMSYSLKRIAKYLGYDWRTSLNGYEILRLYEKWKKTRNEELLKQMLLYNEDDVRATKLVLDFMRSYSSFS